MKQSLQVLLIIFSMGLQSGCNHLFYYPDQEVYATPDKAKLQYDPLKVMTEDGESLQAWHIKAKTSTKGCVLHFHGNAQNMTAHFFYSFWLANEGYDVFTFDYRGYGKSSGEPSRDGTVIDGVTMIRFFAGFPVCKNKPKIVFGQSLGGAIAIASLVESRTNQVDLAVIESSFSSYRQIARDKLASVWLTWPLQWPLSFLVSDQFSPRDMIKYLKIPVLLVYGKLDQVIPYEHGEELFHLANEPKELWTVEKGHHTEAFISDKIPFRSRLLKSMAKIGKK